MTFLKEQPKHRGDCQDQERPCPWMSCKWHMLHMQSTHKTLALRKGTDDEILDYVWSLPWSCVLDLADRGDATLEEIGECTGMTRERIRQIEGRKRLSGHTDMGIVRLRHGKQRRQLQELKG